MAARIALVDFSKDQISFKAALQHCQIAQLPDIAQNKDAAFRFIDKEEPDFLFLHCDQFGEAEEELTRFFQRNVGCVPNHQFLIHNNPKPTFMMQAYEYGFEQVTDFAAWPLLMLNLFESELKKVKDNESTEAMTRDCQRALKHGNTVQLNQILKKMSDRGSYDYVASYNKGIILFQMGYYENAVKALEQSVLVHSFFPPAKNVLAEGYLILGKKTEAVAMLEELEQINGDFFDRKISLVGAYCDSDKMETAELKFKEAEILRPNSKRLIEAKIHLLFRTQKYDEAIRLIEVIDELGPHLALKLNDLGVRLSKTGRGKSALILYQKAHKVARSELKYKISLNAALAASRIGDHEQALSYINQCEKEYGRPFDKSTEVKNKILEMRHKPK